MSKVEDILTESNLPKKVLISIIGILFSAVVALCIYVYNNVIDVTYPQQIEQLKEYNQNLFIELEKQAIKLNEISEKQSIFEVQIREYYDNRLHFIVKTMDAKNSQQILDVLELSKKISEQGKKSITYEPRITEIRTSHKVEFEVKQEQKPIMPDTTKKEGLFKRIFK